ncbi:uncharacterized protein FIESC28_06197 [Fusarium coffeatum]|uniref:Chitin-binding type-1 domain-containing protein n=1 Tax=Fusarium coffeatum TaxID=231269 RepID=A0A366RLX7_9HYPO|nr:uncharacterized protein FIESC28_06197 [Fusarium coffeatum]RBR18131.1 hypothetical protein FIESC28_06197 [Fusarium coffeatum]
MLRRRILPLALWVQLAIAFGSDMLKLKTGSEMISLSDAAMSEILLPDSVSNFTELFEDNNQLQSYGLHARQRQCTPAPMAYDAVPEATPASQAVAAVATPNNAAQANATIPLHKSAAPAVSPVRKAKHASTAVVVTLVNPSAVHQPAITPKHRSAVEVQVYTAPRDMIVSQVVDVVLLDRRDAGIGDECCATRGCANPATEKCCKNGGCEKGTTCCENECCRSSGYCGSDGYCKACPVPTRTITSTYAFTTTAMRTVRVTDDIEPDTGNAPEFSCVPMTATNDVGATLELDSGCVLHYEPPGETSTGGRARRDIEAPTATAPAPVDRGLLARQASCNPSTTYTSTIWKTELYTRTGTQTVTVAGEDATFSCPEMEVTNDVGDTLALDEECVLSFSPAEPTASGLSPQGGGQGGGQAGGGSAGPSAAAGGDGDSVGSVERVQVLLTVGFVIVSVVLVAL